MPFLKIFISFTSLIPCLLPPTDEREMTERTTAQLPANKKCCLLIFAIVIGCLVLAAIPARNPRLSLSIIPKIFGRSLCPATCYAFASGLANNLVPILSSRRPPLVILSRFCPRVNPQSYAQTAQILIFSLLNSKIFTIFAPDIKRY